MRIKIYINDMTNPLISSDISIFLPRISKFFWRYNFCSWRHQQNVMTWIKLYRTCGHILIVIWQAFLSEMLSKGFDKKNWSEINFFKRCSWLKFNKLGLALGINLKFYISVTIWLKRKVRMFWQLTCTFVEVTGENLIAGLLVPSVLCCCLFKFLGRNRFSQ